MPDASPVESVFLAALACPPADRGAFLDDACGGDAGLRARVEKMLSAQPDLGGFLDRPAAGPFPAPEPAADPPGVSAGAVVAGRYELTEPVGEGGMGVVWRAHQTEPVKRRVAVKLIKAGMDSRAVLARFEAERQALALMDHPSIARVYDGGLYDGRPFFAMELIDGVPITEYCDARRLTPRERLELFVPVCQAVQHAHQKGVIHRDLKPSNVLVATIDGRPVPKVIDFGVAKATGGRLTEHTLSTGLGAVVGTPQYMSPEQATFDNADVDTRSDVYSLGVLLYELLVGSPPFSMAELEAKGLLEVLRVVREEEPSKPSTKLGAAAALPSLSASRGTEPRRLTALLRSDLDWVVMKALEKDRGRRYETANAFAADVLRHLAGEPVVAHPPATSYRLRKFVRRNQGPVVATALVFLTLLAGIAGTTTGLIRANRAAGAERLAKEDANEQREAAERAAANERAANERTQKRLGQIERGVEVFAGLLRGINPRSEEKGGKPLYEQLRERAERAADQLREEAVGDPLAEARLQTILGTTLVELGGFVRAAEVLERAGATRERELGADHPDALDTRHSLARAYQGVGRMPEAIALFERVHDAQARTLGADHPDTLTTLTNLAGAYLADGRVAEAIPRYERLRDALVRTRGADHPGTLVTLNNLAVAYRTDGRPNGTIALLEQVRDAQVRTRGADHPDTLNTLTNLAAAYRDTGRAAEGIVQLERVRDARAGKLGADHPDTLTTLNSLARAYHEAGRAADALALLERVRDARVRTQGADHPDALAMLNNLAVAYRAAGRPADAVAQYERLRDAVVRTLGADHPHTLATLHNLAYAYRSVGLFDRSIPLYEDVLARKSRVRGRGQFDTLVTVAHLGVNYLAAGRPAESIPLLEEAYRAATTHPALGWVGPELLEAYRRTGGAAEAARLVGGLVADARRRLPAGGPELTDRLGEYGRVLAELKAFAAAEPLLRESLAAREKAQPDAWATFDARVVLGQTLLGQARYAEAGPLLLAGYEGLKAHENAIPPDDRARVPEALDRLIELSAATNQPADRAKWRAERANYPFVAPPPRAVVPPGK